MTPLARAAEGAKGAGSGLSAPLLLGGTLLCLAALLLVLSDADVGSPELAAPSLNAGETACDAPIEAAGERAHQAEDAALAKVARYPFAPAEGLRAARLLDLAEHCHARAGNAAGSERAADRKRAWQALLERDYRDHLNRYRRALHAQRPAQAREDVSFLLELLSQQDGPFVAQLRDAERELDARLDAEQAR